MVSSNVIIMFVSLLIFAILIYSLVVSCDKVKEGWVNYKQSPYGNINTGAGDSGITPVAFMNILYIEDPIIILHVI